MELAITTPIFTALQLQIALHAQLDIILQLVLAVVQAVGLERGQLQWQAVVQIAQQDITISIPSALQVQLVFNAHLDIGHTQEHHLVLLASQEHTQQLRETLI